MVCIINALLDRKKGLNPRMYESWVDIMTIKTYTITLLQYGDSLDDLI